MVNVVGLRGVPVFVRGSCAECLPKAVKRKIDSREEFFVMNVSRRRTPDRPSSRIDINTGLLIQGTVVEYSRMPPVLTAQQLAFDAAVKARRNFDCRGIADLDALREQDLLL